MNDAQHVEESEDRVISFVVEEPDRRLDKVLKDRVPELSRSQGRRLIESGDVVVDGKPRKLPPSDEASSPLPQAIPLDIIYEDEYLIGVNKPAGMVVHPAPGHPHGTLVNALLAHDQRIADVGPPNRPGIVHRLDRETSGVIIVAKQAAVLQALQQQFRNREVEKVYLALVHGRVQPPEGIIEVPIGRHPEDRQRLAPLADGKYARTRYRAVEYLDGYTLIEVYPYTGRTHQIRVHFSWFGHPVVGDDVYGRRGEHLLDDRHFLHAWRLRCVHPVSGEDLSLEARVPQDLSDFLERLR